MESPTRRRDPRSNQRGARECSPQTSFGAIVQPVDLPQYDLTDVDAETRKAKLDVFRREEAMNTFDLVNGPLIRGFVVQLGETESILFLTAHHLVCDGWSYNVLLEELSELYSAKVRGERPSLKQAPAFGRYARTQAAMNGDADDMAS